MKNKSNEILSKYAGLAEFKVFLINRIKMKVNPHATEWDGFSACRLSQHAHFWRDKLLIKFTLSCSESGTKSLLFLKENSAYEEKWEGTKFGMRQA